MISQAAMPLPGRTLAQTQRSARPVRGVTGHPAAKKPPVQHLAGNWG